MPSKDPYLKKVGQAVRNARRAAGLSQIDLSNQSGITQHAISQIESGQRNPTALSLLKLAISMGVQPGTLLPNLSRQP